MGSAPDSAEQDRKTRNFNRRIKFQGFETSNMAGAPRTRLPGDTAEKRRFEAKRAAVKEAMKDSSRRNIKGVTDQQAKAYKNFVEKAEAEGGSPVRMKRK
jgi:hypothetical protein